MFKTITLALLLTAVNGTPTQATPDQVIIGFLCHTQDGARKLAKGLAHLERRNHPDCRWLSGGLPEQGAFVETIVERFAYEGHIIEIGFVTTATGHQGFSAGLDTQNLLFSQNTHTKGV